MCKGNEVCGFSLLQELANIIDKFGGMTSMEPTHDVGED
jgi:hypothetical protein